MIIIIIIIIVVVVVVVVVIIDQLIWSPSVAITHDQHNNTIFLKFWFSSDWKKSILKNLWKKVII